MQKISFNTGWTFCKKDSTNVQTVTLPHDAMIHEKRAAGYPSGSAGAYFSGGSYVYEKVFTSPAEWAEQTVLLQFEGVYKHARVFVNGKEAGGVAYGYIPFFVPLDGLNYGTENVVRVECENADQPDSRWYSGAGIYRPVWLWTGPKDAIAPGSVKISTVSYDPAVIRVTSPLPIQVEVEGVTGEGTDFRLTIPHAKLWNEDAPNLYTAHVTRREDREDIPFGIRLVEWSPKGLLVNGKQTLLRGGCVHHDSGILGAATFDRSEYRRVKKLKEAGFNAIRSAHNPASRALLEACDRLGMYVMDETWDMWYSHKSKFDYAGDFMAHYKDDIRAMVDRDFNHPCVILYSIGNEVSEPAQQKGVDLAKEMVEYIHGLDANRAVTGGMNLMIIARSAKGSGVYKEDGGRDDGGKQKALGGMSSTMFNMVTSMVGTGMNKGANGKKADAITSPVLDALDIAGYNYASGRYPLEGRAHPQRVIFGSETFPQDIWKNWQMVKRYPYLVGDFMWAAWDYLGEAGIGAWAYTPDGKAFDKPYPWLLADVGALDLLGDPNGELFLAQAAWGLLDQPAIAVQPVNHPGVKPAKSVWRGTNALPSWSWQGCEGNRAVVEVYTDSAEVELLLNGKSLGKKKVKEGRAMFKTKYASGTLEAVARDSAGRELSRSILRSAAGPVGICVEPEEGTVWEGDIVYIPVSLRGENGEVEHNADRRLTVTVEGGELLAFGSANPRTEERFDAANYTSCYGRALAVVRADRAGRVTVSVTDGKQTGTAEITVKGE